VVSEHHGNLLLDQCRNDGLGARVRRGWILAGDDAAPKNHIWLEDTAVGILRAHLFELVLARVGHHFAALHRVFFSVREGRHVPILHKQGAVGELHIQQCDWPVAHR